MNKSYYKETRINTILKGEIGKKNLGKIGEEDQREKEKNSGEEVLQRKTGTGRRWRRKMWREGAEGG